MPTAATLSYTSNKMPHRLPAPGIIAAKKLHRTDEKPQKRLPAMTERNNTFVAAGLSQ